MPKILFSRLNALRKRQYQIQTSLVEMHGSKSILKRAAHPDALPHLKRILENEIKLSTNREFPYLVLKGKLDGQHVYYPYLELPTLELAIEKALIYQDWDRAEFLFGKGLELIDYLPKMTLGEEHPDKATYISVFGAPPDKHAVFSRIGLPDVTAGNLVLTQYKPTLIDCEWLFSFPIEIEFIKFRYFWNLIARFSSFWKLHAASLPLVKEGTIKLYIPLSWQELFLKHVPHWDGCLHKEIAFQVYASAYPLGMVPAKVVFQPYAKYQQGRDLTTTSMLLQKEIQLKKGLSRIKKWLTIYKSRKGRN